MDDNTQSLKRLQAEFLKDEQDINAFKGTVSLARFKTYLDYCGGDARGAIELYCCNARLSQAIYLPLQIWEISLRNKLNDFLVWKYGHDWPYDTRRAVRNLQFNDQKRLREAKERQERERKRSPVPTNAIVADLSAGFWVSLLTMSYDVPFSWRYNLGRIFPHKTPYRADAAKQCECLLALRNRVAHHEPIFHLPLVERHADITAIVSSMCQAHSVYLKTACTFAEQFEIFRKISN